jgi:hypothetical protein
VTDAAPSAAYVLDANGSARRINRRKRQNAIFIAASILVVASLAVGAVYLLSSIPTGSENSAQARNSRPRSESRARKLPDVQLPDEVTSLLGEASASETAANSNPQEPTEVENHDEDWIDARREAARSGDVSVRIVGAAIRSLSTERRGGGQPPARKTDEYLAIRLELTNQSTDQNRTYMSWTMRPTEVELVDDAGQPYGMRLFSNAARLGQQQQAEIKPSGSIEDVLLFGKPMDEATFLRLTLPAAAFGEEGMLKFQLPMKMVVVDKRLDEPTESLDPLASDKSNQVAAESEATAGTMEEEPEFGPIAIPGLHDQQADRDSSEETETSSFADDPEMMRRGEELRKQQAKRRENHQP